MIGKVFVVLCTVFGAAMGEFPLVAEPRDIHLPRATESYRLPNNTKPLSYDITLEPEFEYFTFTGKVVIDIEVLEDTDVITLHTNDLELNACKLRRGNEVDDLEIRDLSYESRYNFSHFHLAEPVLVDDILTLSIEYAGNLQSDRRGFYRALYMENGQEKWFGMTQFESTSARLAFPCYDEPGIKTPFTLHIIRKLPYKSIANMELDGEPEELDDERVKDNYKESVKMSTYLVAFIVSEMNSTERREGQAVYAAPALIGDGRAEYALEAGIKILQAMEEFTDIPFAIPKMDQAAIPDNYFSAGAMENWGLVTYREQYLLYKEGVSTTANKQTIAGIIAHEYGHQWFGNLVSPKWWSWIWLNEGFATYFEQYAPDAAALGMRMMDQFTNLVNYPAMAADGINARPMTYDAQTPTEISFLFDRVAYEKSGAVIRMMEHMLTTPIFKEGLRIYLHSREYEAAEAQDLWDGLQEALDEDGSDILQGRNVEEIMETWNTQAGFPLVTVSREDGKIVLSQERFLDPPASSSNIWTVPINFARATSDSFQHTNATYWLETAEENTGIEIGDDEWLILNNQATGYYRVNYDEVSWQLIIELLNSEEYNKVHLLNRNQLIADAFALAKANITTYAMPLSLVSYLKRETDYIPMYTFFNELTSLNTGLINTGEYYEIFQKFVREILQASFNLGEPETHTQRLNRINILRWLCLYGHQGCLTLTHDTLVAEAIAPPDFQTAYYCGGLMTDVESEAKWTFLYNRYTGDEADSTEKSRILSAFGCSVSETHLTRLLDAAIKKNTDYEFGSATSSFSSVYTASKFGLDFTLKYITENYEDIVSGLTLDELSSVLLGIATRLGTEEQLAQVQAFQEAFADQLEANGHTSIIDGIKTVIQLNIAARGEDKILADIEKWLDDYNSAFVFAVSLPLLMAALLTHLLA